MSKLSLKIILTFLPLAICIIFFGAAYYNARSTLIMEHAEQSAKLAVAQGTRDIAHYIERRFTEFDQLSLQMSLCQDEARDSGQQLMEALAYTSGFSMLMLNDLSGHILSARLSANKSNSYVLRRNVSGVSILNDQARAMLTFGYHDWLQIKPELALQEKTAREQLYQLKARGEYNSIASRRLQSKLIELRKAQSLPKAVVSLLSEETVARLGLIFEGETHLLSRPYLNCKDELIGYYTAIIDKTQFENRLNSIKKSMLEGSIQHIDLGLIRNRDRKLLTTTHYLSQRKLSKLESTIRIHQYIAPILVEY
ncbi:hypothetical protein [Vibrio sonorensis]|uniref:hypothetical protein n=1 Tax=Vibrio sonorensis TaxID=1004316 RepID=UPI0009FD124A|nr:hypothetical protein [Vibrio sonorensis]